MDEGVPFTLSSPGGVVVEQPTPQLRFVRRTTPDGAGVRHILQQMWRDLRGTERWRDVPLAGWDDAE